MFKTKVTKYDLIYVYGLLRVLEAQEDYLNNRHNSLCWFFIADYCNSIKVSLFDSVNYNYAKDLFFKLLKEI